MKKYIIILIAFLALFNCGEKDDFKPLSDLVVPDLFTPSLNKVDATTIGNTIPISINDFSSLSDISQGVVSTSWTISNGTRFLKDTFKRKDSLNLAAFIDPEFESSSWKATVHVLFQEIGEKTVKLTNYFPQPVSYLGKDAVQSGDLWSLTNTLTYDVYGELNAEASITNTATSNQVLLAASQNPSSTDTSGFTTLTIEAGTSLNFKDLTTIGRPDGRVWNFESGTPERSEDEEVDILYNRPGEYTATITVKRNKRGKQLYPVEQTKTLPVLVKVIPSTQPFVISANGMAVDDNNPDVGTTLLSFGVNGILDTVENSNTNFTVDIVNGAFTSSSNPSAVRISSGNESVVELVLSEPIYNTDTVTISYNGTTLKSIDDRVLQTFTNQPVDNLNQNFLTDVSNPSFETSASNTSGAQGYNIFVVGNELEKITNPDSSLYAERSTERASDGSASIKYNLVLPLETTQGYFGLINTIGGNSNIPTGNYKLTFDIFIETGSQVGGFFNAIQGASSNPKGLGIPFNSPPIGEWFTVERTFSVDGTLGGNIVFNVRNADNSGITGRQVFFLDNIKALLLEER